MDAVRRTSRRLSGVFDKVVGKLTERPRDPEEDPDFAARNPQWEDQLPPIHGVSKPTDGKAQSTAALLQALEQLPPQDTESLGKKNWKRAYKAVQRILIVRKKARNSAVGTGARLEGYALGFWSPYSQSRLKLFTFLHCQRTEYCILLMICAHLIVLIFQVQESSRMERWTDVQNFKIDFLDAFITTLYTIEMLLKIACLGFVKHRHTYLRNAYNRLDFVIIMDSWIHIIAKSVTGKDYFTRIAVFRIFRGLLALKHITFFADVIAIMSAVNRSVGPLQNVILLTLFILVFYALLGTQFLQKALSSRCMIGSRISFPERYCDQRVKDGYICPGTQKCKMYGNPNWGSTSFDIIHFSLLTMFQIVSLEGWSLLMYRVKDAEGERANSYFMTLVVLGTYFLFNVFIAGISGVFLRVRAEHQALLKKFRSNQVSFYKATVMANVLRDDIIKDDSKMKWYERVINRSKRITRNVSRALSRTTTSMKAAFQSRSFRFSGGFGSNRAMSRTMTRSMTMGLQVASTVSHKARMVVEHPSFNWGVLMAITANAVVLCLYKYGMSKDLLYLIYGTEGVLLIIFSVELLFRFLAYGLVSFTDDKMNVLDTLAVAVSAGAFISRSYPNITAVRIMRWFYLSKKHVEKHPSIVAICLSSVGSLMGVFFFYLLIILVISIISMELYSGQFYRFPDGYPRANHDHILTTMLLWFSVTTGEQWPNQMWNSMRPGVSYNVVASFLYVFYFILTVHIIMNLIIAVLLERNELTDNEKKQIQRIEHMRLIRRMHSRASTRSASWMVGAVEGVKAGFGSLSYRMHSLKVKSLKRASRKASHAGGKKQGGRQQSHKEETRDSHLPGAPSGQAETVAGVTLPVASTAADSGSTDTGNVSKGGSSQVLQSSGFPTNLGGRRGSKTALEQAALTLANLTKPPSRSMMRSMRKTSSKRQSFQLSDFEDIEKGVRRLERPWYLREGSLLMFGDKSLVKKVCNSVVNSRLWWWFSILWVIVSAWLVIEMQYDGSFITLIPLLEVLHKLVFVVFVMEFVMKVISQGLVFSPDAYLGDFYNLLDLFLLVVDLLDIPSWSENTERVIHALIALRPFRFVCRIPGLRTLMSNLFKTIPAVVSVLMLTFMIFVIFGSIGVQQFRGLFHLCNDDSIKHRAYCIGYYTNDRGVLAPRAWKNQIFHFDDIGNAFLSLFVCSTFDNWITNWLYPAMDIVGEDRQPVRDYKAGNALFFVVFCCCGGFFIVRIFIGVFINEFGKNSGSKLLTERQKLWRDMNRIIQKMEPSALPRPPNTRIRTFCFHLIRNPVYENTMIVALMGYSGFLASNTAVQPPYISNRRQIAHCALTAYFMIESVIKFLGDEFRVYRYEYSRHIEAGISILATAGLMGEKGTVRGYLGRFAYISRVFCIIPHVPRARVIMRTLFICFPTMAEIMALLAVYLFAFAGIGFQMFSHVADGECIGQSLNFHTFVNSFITVFQVITLDNWSCIMADVMLAPPKCTNGSTLAQNDCGFPFAGVIYFVFLVVVASHIFMNLFVAVILDAITFGLVNENSLVTPEHLLAYKHLWSQRPFDPEATGYIGIHKLRGFVNALGIPLGRRHNSPSGWYSRIEWEVINFRVPNKGIPFKQLLETLALYKIGPTGLPLTLRIEREKRIQSVYREGAVTKIAAATKGFLLRARIAREKAEKEAKEKEEQEKAVQEKAAQEQEKMETTGEQRKGGSTASSGGHTVRNSSMLVED